MRHNSKNFTIFVAEITTPTFNLKSNYLMKTKILTVLMLLMGYTTSLQAQENTEAATTQQQDQDAKTELHNRKVWNDRKSYFNIYYCLQDLEYVGGEEKLESKWSFGFASGKTFYFPKRPIMGMKLGIDWTFIDLNGSCYDPIEENTDLPSFPPGYDIPSYYDELDKIYKAEVGMQFGPSITINPVSHLKVNAYFRVQPSYSAFYDGNDFYGAYATYFNCGATVAFKMISVGVEQRWGTTKYKIETDDINNKKITQKIKTKGPRFFVSFRF